MEHEITKLNKTKSEISNHIQNKYCLSAIKAQNLKYTRHMCDY